MIGTIRRHSQALWWVIVAAVIVSFVWFYGSSNSSMSILLEGQQTQYGSLYGRQITDAAIAAARKQADLRYYLQGQNSRSMNRSEEMLRSEIYQQVLIQRELEANGIIPNEAAVGQEIANSVKNSVAARQNGTTASGAEIKKEYDDFIANRLEKAGFSEADFVRMVRGQVGIGHLQELVTVPAALVTPREASDAFRRENETMVASAVLFHSSNYLSSAVSSPENVGRFYTNNMARYFTEEKLGVNYVRFEASNHVAAAEGDLAKIPNLAGELEKMYASRTNQNPSAFLDAEGKAMTREAALAKMRADEVLGLSVQRAFKQAADFYNGLGKAKVTANNFIAHATNSISATAGFSVGSAPANGLMFLGVTAPFSEIPNASEALGSLNIGNPFSSPMRGKDCVIIASFRERVPSAIQPLDSILARVQVDHKEQESRNSAQAAASAFLTSVTNGLTQGKSFADLAKVAELPVIDLPAISASMNSAEGMPPGLNIFELRGELANAKPGEAVLLGRSSGSPAVVVLKERKPVSEETLKAGLNAYMEELRRRRMGGVFQSWFQQKQDDSGLSALLAPAKEKGSN